MSPVRMKRMRQMRHGMRRALMPISVAQAEIATIRAPGIGTIDMVPPGPSQIACDSV